MTIKVSFTKFLDINMPVQIKTKKPSLSINKVDSLLDKENQVNKSKIIDNSLWICKICSHKNNIDNHKCLNCKNLNPENNSSYAMKKPITYNNEILNPNKKEFVSNNQNFNNNIPMKNTPLKTINKSKIKIEENKLEKKPSSSKLKTNNINSNLSNNNNINNQVHGYGQKNVSNLQNVNNNNPNSNKLNSQLSVMVNTPTNYNNDPKFNTFGSKKQEISMNLQSNQTNINSNNNNHNNNININQTNKISLQESNFSFGGNINMNMQMQRKK